MEAAFLLNGPEAVVQIIIYICMIPRDYFSVRYDLR
jgi:hypothetical protein